MNKNKHATADRLDREILISMGLDPDVTVYSWGEFAGPGLIRSALSAAGKILRAVFQGRNDEA